jgi:hypothetical protein
MNSGEIKSLYEILVPTRWGDDPTKSIKKRHHLCWDRYVQTITGGLTIMTPSKGRWLFEGSEYHERVIPVRIMCGESDINKIAKFTLRHYRQKAVMYYQVANYVRVIHAAAADNKNNLTNKSS